MNTDKGHGKARMNTVTRGSPAPGPRRGGSGGCGNLLRMATLRRMTRVEERASKRERRRETDQQKRLPSLRPPVAPHAAITECWDWNPHAATIRAAVVTRVRATKRANAPPEEAEGRGRGDQSLMWELPHAHPCLSVFICSVRIVAVGLPETRAPRSVVVYSRPMALATTRCTNGVLAVV
jgi:hypothetical protein